MTRVAELSAEITANTGDFERGLSNVEKAVAGTRTTIMGMDKDINLMGRNMGSASDAMRGMGLALPITPMAALGQGVRVVSDYLKSAVNDTVAYAAQVRELGRSIGASAEQTSMLIQAADDVNVSFESLSAGMLAAIRKGVEPSIDGLGKLADEYNAIQDPIAKTKFLMDNFGRSGSSLAPLMEKGAAGIKELGEAAENAGLVLSGDAVQATREYEIAMDNAGDAAKSFGYAVGQNLIPPLTAVVNVMNDNINFQNRLNRAMEDGIFTAAELAQIQLGSILPGMKQKAVILAEAEARDKLVKAMKAQGLAQRFAQYEMEGLNNEVKRGADGLAALAGIGQKAAVGLTDFGRAAGGLRDSLTFAYDASMLLAMGLDGALGQAQEEYNKVIAETTPEIERLTAEIAEYQRTQGQTVTVTEVATTSLHEYELGTLKAAEAARDLSDYVGGDALELAQLHVNADKAQEAVNKLGEGLGISKDYTIDHTKALAEDNAALNELIGKQEAAEKAIRDATAAMILQQTATALGPELALEYAHATGLLSDADYELGKALQRATDAADLNNDSIIEGAAEQKIYYEEVLRVTNQTIAMATGNEAAASSMGTLGDSISPVEAGLKDTGLAADGATSAINFIPKSVAVDSTPAISSLDNARTSAYNFHTALDNIPRTVNVSIITDNYQNYHGYQIPGTGGPGGAAGMDFIVPPGYPHDSFPMRVQSGERVQVTPAGAPNTGGSGVTINQVINNFVAPVSGASLLQTARAVAGAW